MATAYEGELELELEGELEGLGEFEQHEGEWEQQEGEWELGQHELGQHELAGEFEGDQFFGRAFRGIGRFVRRAAPLQARLAYLPDRRWRRRSRAHQRIVRPVDVRSPRASRPSSPRRPWAAAVSSPLRRRWLSHAPLE